MIRYLTLENLALAWSILAALATTLGHTLPACRFQRACLAFGINAGRIVAELHGKPDPSASAATVGVPATLEAFTSAPSLTDLSRVDAVIADIARLTAAHDALTLASRASAEAAKNAITLPAAPDTNAPKP